MKKNLLLFLLFTSLIQLQSYGQAELWGMTSSGGQGAGTIFKTNADGAGFVSKMMFPVTNPGRHPGGSLTLGNNGKLYGMTNRGGGNDVGIMFGYDPTDGSYAKILEFDGATKGSYPNGSLILFDNGKLYGMTGGGGENNFGVLFEYNPTDDTYSKKIDFDGAAKGSYPIGNLTLGGNGKLYGIASQGGANNFGALFEYDPVDGTYAKKLDFNGVANGRSLQGSLTLGNNGKLYGMTNRGGANDFGVLFEYDPADGTYIKRIDFDGTAKGNYPNGSLTLSSNGKLYGMTSQGGVNNFGVLFEYDPNTGIYAKKLDFDGTGTGNYPNGSLNLGGSGKLYGMTSRGGVNNFGVLFEYDPDGTYSKKLDFDGAAKGRYPNGNLTLVSNGKLYGMTSEGGANGFGVLFDFNPVGATYTKKIDFDEAANGSYPLGSLALGGKGKLYGMTQQGGANNFGVLFEYDPADGTYAKKLDFDGMAMGSSPWGSLTLHPNGKLYGMTWKGGANNFGVLFEYEPIDGIYTKKIDFDGTMKGSFPIGNLILSDNEKLYGMTWDGGTSGFGVLFEYDPITASYIKKLDFDGPAKGRYPKGSLTMGGNGKLYGMTQQGGANNFGVLFEYNPANGDYVKKINFDGATKGSYPESSLTLGGNGKLYGMTQQGGANNFGVLFEYDPTTSTYVRKLDFDGSAKGGYPFGSLTVSLNGKLYGMTWKGGTNDVGVLFEYNPTDGIYSKKLDFDGAINGSLPPGNLFYAAIQTIGFGTISAKVFGDSSFDLIASGGTSSNPVTFASSDLSVATVSGNTVTIVGTGTITITASQAGNSNYLAAKNVEQILTVNRASQTIIFNVLTDKTLVDLPFTLSATASSGLSVSFSTASNKIALTGNQVTMVSAGRAIITAAQPGDANFNSVSLDRSFCIKPAKPIVTLSNVNTASPTLTSSAPSGNQWYLNNTLIEGSTGTTFNVSRAGIYKVQVKADDCYSAFSDDQFIIITALEPIAAHRISVYPNPTYEELVIDLRGFEKNQTVFVSTFDQVGRSINQLASEGGVQLKVDVRSFAPGQYIIQLRQGKKIATKSFIKSNN